MTDFAIAVAMLALLWFVTFAVASAACTGAILCVINPIERWWDRRRHAQDHRAAIEHELARIDREGAESVRRLHAAYVPAQRQLRLASDRRPRP